MLGVWGEEDFGVDLRKRDQLEERGEDGRPILKWVFKKWDGEAWSGLLWLRLGIGGGLL
jgi:hypothetical protein